MSGSCTVCGTLGGDPAAALTHDGALVDQPLEDLFKEEGIALRLLAYIDKQRLQRIAVAQQLCDQPLALRLGKWPQADDSDLSA